MTQDSTAAARCYIQAARCCRQLGAAWLDTEAALLETACSRLDASANGVLLQMLSETYISQGAQPGADTTACYEKALNCLEQLLARGYVSFAVRQNQAVVLEYLDRFDEAEAALTGMLADYPYDYRVPMRLAMLYLDMAGERTDDGARQTLYTQAAQQYEAAQQLYASASVQDSEMLRLADMMTQLQAAGWL